MIVATSFGAVLHCCCTSKLSNLVPVFIELLLVSFECIAKFQSIYLHCHICLQIGVCSLGEVLVSHEQQIGFVFGVVRYPYQAPLNTLVLSCDSLRPIIFATSHPCTCYCYKLVSFAIHFGTVRSTISFGF